MFEESSHNSHIDWNYVIKKEARGINNEDLGRSTGDRSGLCFSTKRNDKKRKILYSKEYGRVI